MIFVALDVRMKIYAGDGQNQGICFCKDQNLKSQAVTQGDQFRAIKDQQFRQDKKVVFTTLKNTGHNLNYAQSNVP